MFKRGLKSLGVFTLVLILSCLFAATVSATTVDDVGNNSLRIGADIYELNNTSAYTYENVLDSLDRGGPNYYFKIDNRWYDLNRDDVKRLSDLLDPAKAVAAAEVRSWPLQLWYGPGVTPEPMGFSVTASAIKGYVEGTGEYVAGAEVSLRALPEEGYDHLNWVDENGEEVSTDNPYTFAMPRRPLHLTANFVRGLDGLVESSSAEYITTKNNMDYPWVADHSVTGRVAYYPTNQGVGNSRSAVTCTVSGSGILSYDYKVSAENNYDYLIVYVDGEIVKEHKVLTDWDTGSIELLAEGQTVSFEYKKDGSVNSNADRVWLSNLSFEYKEVALMPAVTLEHGHGAWRAVNDGDEIVRDLDTESGEYILSLGENTTGSAICVTLNGEEIFPYVGGDYTLTVDESCVVEISSSKEGFLSTSLTFYFKVLSLSLQGLVEADSLGFISAANNLKYPWVKDSTVTDKVAYYPTNQGAGNSRSSITCTVTGTGYLHYDYRVSAENNYDYLIVYVDDQIVQEHKTLTDWDSHSLVLSKDVQVVRFEYKKDVSGDKNDDRVWVANVKLEPVDAAIMPAVTLLHDSDEPQMIEDGAIIVRDAAMESCLYTLRLGENLTGSDIAIKCNGSRVLPSAGGDYELAIEQKSEIEITSSKEDHITTHLGFVIKVLLPLEGLVDSASVESISAVNDLDYPWVRDSTVTDRTAYHPTNQGVHNSSSFVTFDVSGIGLLTYDYRVSAEDNWDYMRIYLDDVLVREYRTSGEWSTDYLIMPRGNQTVKFEYKKDTSGNSKDDRVWLANICLVTGDAEVAVTANDDELGAVSDDSGTYAVGTEIVLSATPVDPNTIALVGWYDNVAEEWLEGDGESKVSPTYTFDLLGDRVITAVFKRIAIMPDITLDHDQDDSRVLDDGGVIIRDTDKDSDAYILRLGTNTTGSDIRLLQNGAEVPTSGEGLYNLAIEEASIVEIISKKTGYMTTYLKLEFKVFSRSLQGLVDSASAEYVTGLNDLTYPWVIDRSVSGKVAYYPTNQGVHNSSSFATFTVTSPGMLAYDYRVSAEDNWDYMKVYVDDVLVKEYKTSGDWAPDYIVLTEERQTVKFEYKKDGSGNSKDDRVWLANVGLYWGEKVLTLAVDGSEYGSITASGDLLVPGENTIEAGTQVTLEAAAKSGAVFYGWVDHLGQLLSLETEYIFRVRDDITVKAVFAAEGAYVARRGGQFYTEADGGLKTALEQAVSGDIITLLQDYTLTDNVTVPAGVLLLLPCSKEDQKGYTDTGFNPDGTSTSKTDLSRLYKTLTVPGGATLTIEGTLMVNAVTGRPAAGHYDMDITGGYSQIALEGDIIVKEGGLLDVFGRIKGNGRIEALEGGSIGDLYVVKNWRGGTQALYCYLADVFPFNQYELHNIEADLKINAGASYYGNVKMYANSKYYYTRFCQFDQANGLLKLSPGAYAMKTYDSVSGQTTITINGGAEETGGSMDVAGMGVSTVDFLFPIDGHIDFILENGDYVVNHSLKFLTGSALTIAEDARLIVKKGAQLILYEEFLDPLNTSTTQYPLRDPADFRLDGILLIEGSFGGLIKPGGSAQVVVGEDATLTVSSKEAEGYATNVFGVYTVTANLYCDIDGGLFWYYYPSDGERGDAVLVLEDCGGLDYINLNEDAAGYLGHIFMLDEFVPPAAQGGKPDSSEKQEELQYIGGMESNTAQID